MPDSPEPLTTQDRKFDSEAPPALLQGVQGGVMRSVYRGVPFLKSPFDIGIYLQLLSRLRPRTVIEVGTKHGGSALWFADMLSAAGVESPRIVSVDIEPIARFTDPRITFLEGSASQLGAVLTDTLLASLPHPWLVVEDSSHFYADSLAVLQFFDRHLATGDYIVVEDGVVAQLPQAVYRRYDDGPNRAVHDFLAAKRDAYRIDAALCDFYGANLTYNPNGYLVKVQAPAATPAPA